MEKIYHCSPVKVMGIGAVADVGRKLGYGGRLVTEKAQSTITSCKQLEGATIAFITHASQAYLKFLYEAELV